MSAAKRARVGGAKKSGFELLPPHLLSRVLCAISDDWLAVGGVILANKSLLATAGRSRTLWRELWPRCAVGAELLEPEEARRYAQGCEDPSVLRRMWITEDSVPPCENDLSCRRQVRWEDVDPDQRIRSLVTTREGVVPVRWVSVCSIWGLGKGCVVDIPGPAHLRITAVTYSLRLNTLFLLSNRRPGRTAIRVVDLDRKTHRDSMLVGDGVCSAAYLDAVGALAVGMPCGGVCLWSLASATRFGAKRVLAGAEVGKDSFGDAEVVCSLHGGRLLAVACRTKGDVRVFRPASGDRWVLRGDGERVTAMQEVVTPRSRLLVVAYKDVLRVWDVCQGTCLHEMMVPGDVVTSMSTAVPCWLMVRADDGIGLLEVVEGRGGPCLQQRCWRSETRTRGYDTAVMLRSGKVMALVNGEGVYTYR